MNPSAGLADRPRAAVRPFLAAVLLLGLGCLWLADARPDPEYWAPRAAGGLSLVLLAVIAWRLESAAPRTSRWLAVGGLAAAIGLAHLFLPVAGLLALAALPVAAAAALLGISAAAWVAAGQALLLLCGVALGLDGPAAGLAIGAGWLAWGVMHLNEHPLQELAAWTRSHYEQAQRALDEARDRKLELEQALQDLAQANRQLTRINTLADGLRRAADDARSAKEQFVANVSHELRTPLNMITGFSEMILQSPDLYGERIPPPLLADLAVIQRNAAHLAELVDDVLDLSQIEANQMALNREYAPFGAIVDEALLAVRPLFESKHLYLDAAVEADLPPVFCDRTRMREVLLNLLSNAGRYTEAGGVQLRVARQGELLKVTVADTGCGIAADRMARLFEPFQQADSALRRRYGGTGLGLPISKRFIELHGGGIEVESREGSGATFRFVLPFDSPAAGESWRHTVPEWEYHQRTHPPKAPRLPLRPRVLVLEAGQTLQRLLERYWEGVEIRGVADPAQAAAQLAHEGAQALVVNGGPLGQTLDEVAGAAWLPADTPTIVCSVPGIHADPATLGVAARLLKPVSREMLLSTLAQLGLPGGTILIVDDEPDVLRLFERMLAGPDGAYRTVLARDGREALAVLGELRPDVILLDLIMPNLDGFQLLALRSQQPAWRDIPVVVVSAQDATGQPVVSTGLAVSRGAGLSARQLLAAIEFFTGMLTPAPERPAQDDPARPGSHVETPASA